MGMVVVESATYGVIKVAICDECGIKWLPDKDGKDYMPEQCPRNACRTRHWNDGGQSPTAIERRLSRLVSKRKKARAKSNLPKVILSGRGSAPILEKRCNTVTPTRGHHGNHAKTERN